MKTASLSNACLLAALLLLTPLGAVAQSNPPSGDLVECTQANGFEPSQQDYHSCAHYFLEHIAEFDAEKILMSSAHLRSGKAFAALIFDAPDQQGQVDLVVTSVNQASRMLVARGRWPTEASHDCRAVADGACSLDRADRQGRPIHLLVRGDDSETTASGYWYRP